MSLLLKSLQGLDTVGSVADNQRMTLITAQGLVNVTWGTLSDLLTTPLNDRLLALENKPSGQPSIWPTARTLSLTGTVAGSVAIDGSANVSLTTSIANNALSIAKTAGLQAALDILTTGVGNRWGTGATTGPQASTFAGDLDTLTGATFVRATSAATNLPAPSPIGYTVLTNGQTNYCVQLALGSGTMYLRSQVDGTWGTWRAVWHTGSLDPVNLLYKGDTATAATKLATARNVALTGTVTAASVQFDGTSNLTLTTAIANNALSFAMVNGLQTALDERLAMKAALGTTALNAVTVQGLYPQPVAANATTARSYPGNNVSGLLEVFYQAALGTIQRYTQANGSGVWARRFDGNSWSSWIQQLDTTAFNPTSKADVVHTHNAADITTGVLDSARVAGGTIQAFSNTAVGANPASYSLSTGTASSAQISGASGAVTVLNLTPGSADTGGMDYQLGFLGTNRDIQVRSGTRSGGWGTWTRLYGSHNFDPTSPVPTTGVLRVGPSDGDSLRLRKDGSFSLNGGEWTALGSASGNTEPNPVFATVRMGATNGAQLTPNENNLGMFISTGATGAIKRFVYGTNGDFTVESGRVIVGTFPVWHSGTFNPDTKLGATATAVAAAKLATARTINGISFDGTANITIPSNVNPDDFVKIAPSVGNYASADALAGKLAYSVCGGTALGTPGPYMTTWNFGDNANRDGQFAWGYGGVGGLHFRSRHDVNNAWNAWREVWTSASFNPATKANLAAPTFTGVTYFDVDGGSTAKFRINYWGADGINLDAVNHDASQFAPLNLRGSSVQINGAAPWTSGNFDPNSRLAARNNLNTNAEQISDWNSAINNGWYMASGAANAPTPTDWFIGTTTQHNADWIQQEVRDFTRGINGPKWYRWKSGGTWGAWTQDFVVGGSLNANRIWTGYDSGIGNSISCSNWFRASGETGLFLADYGGGIHMVDTTYVQTYMSKAFKAGWFEVNGPLHNPQVAANATAFRAYGNYGGGYGMIDGNNHITWYSVGGHLNFGFGVGGVSGKASIQNDGVIYATDFALNSDATLKDITGALVFTHRLMPKRFIWKDSGVADFGFIAQDVQEHYPEAVEVDPQYGTLRLKQQKLVAVVAAQVNVVDDRTLQLQSQVNALQAQVDQLRDLIMAMSTK